MAKDKKILLIFPPQWTPIAPHFAMASLIGQLINNGYQANALDLNIEFYNKILSTKYLNFILDKIKKDYVSLFNTVKNTLSKNKQPQDYSLEEQCDIYKFTKLKEFTSKENKLTEMLPALIPFAVEVLKDKEKFYTPEFLIKAMSTIDNALNLISLAYCPTTLNFDSCYNQFMKFNYKSIEHFVFDKKSNPYWDFLKDKVQQIKAQNYDCVAISLNSSSQMIAGLTLGFLLKKYTKAHVNIGGNFFGRVKDEILKKPEFSKFCDSISIEEGEGPIVEFAKFINNEIKIEQVPNLLYFKNGKVFETTKMCPTRQNDMQNLSLEGYDLTQYFAPHIVMPYQTSRGCYWGKCSFCDQDFGMEFNVKSIEKVISQMQELKEKYGITKYEFIDESVSPSYMKELSKALLKTDINPSFFCDARLETAFCDDIFKSASSAGLKMVLWGLESGSKKIMESINKGIDLDKRFDILKSANKYGIWNFAFIFFGYPLETQEDARETIKMICDNHEFINSYGRSVFTMGRHAKLAQEPEKYGITKLHEVQDEFSPSMDFDCVGMTKQELSDILKECRAECFKYYQNPLWMYLRFREWLFLYIDKHGLEWVSKYNIKL